MKIRENQLLQQLKKSLSQIYIISGDEVLLCQKTADKIRKSVLNAGINERLRYIADSQFDWQDIINENKNLSLFSNQRLFDIQIDKMIEKHTKALMQLSQSLNNDNIILLTLPKIDSRSQKAKWFSQLESNGIFVQIWPIDAHQLPAWIQQRAQDLNLSLSQDAVNMICERGEGNLLALSQELEKLVLINGVGSKINVEKVNESVVNNSRYSIYDLSDRLLMGKTKEAIHCLNQLVEEGTEVSIILWLFNRETQTLSSLFKSIQSSTSLKQACQSKKIWDKRIPFYESALTRHNHITLLYIQNYLAMIDKRIKGLEGPEIDTGFRNLVMMFCGFKPITTELDLLAC